MFLLIFFFLTFSFEKNLNADEIQFADSHGPITVMGDHLHKKNELMLHAYKIKFSISGTRYNYTAEPPLAFQKNLKEKYLKIYQ